MDFQALHIGTYYLYEGERVRLFGKHEALNPGTGAIEYWVTVQTAEGGRREALPHDLQEEGSGMSGATHADDTHQRPPRPERVGRERKEL